MSPDPTDDDEEHDEMVVLFIRWHSTAINRFLEKWGNAVFATPPPFDKPNNSQEFERRMVEYLIKNIEGLSMTTDTSVHCNFAALGSVIGAMCLLEEENWVKSIIDAQPAGWSNALGAINVTEGGKTVPLPLRDSLMFE